MDNLSRSVCPKTVDHYDSGIYLLLLPARSEIGLVDSVPPVIQKIIITINSLKIGICENLLYLS